MRPEREVINLISAQSANTIQFPMQVAILKIIEKETEQRRVLSQYPESVDLISYLNIPSPVPRAHLSKVGCRRESLALNMSSVARGSRASKPEAAQPSLKC